MPSGLMPSGPDWGAFGSFGTLASQIVAAVWAAGVVLALGYLVWGLATARFGNSRGNSIQQEAGRGHAIGGAVSLGLLAALGAVTAIIWSLGSSISA